MPTILIVDDEKNIRATLGRALGLEGYTTAEASDGVQALERLDAGDVDVVLLDLQMPGLDGLGFLEKLNERRIVLPTIVLTAHGTIEKAVRSVRLGAFDFIEKPPSVERILLAVENALKVGRLEDENRRLRSAAGIGAELLGDAPALRALRATIARVAPTEAAVLLEGENGTGKELVARAIHAASRHRDRPLVVVNCAAVPETLFESELFGHARGAFTGATEARRGKFQQADGGTLFLDEIGEVPAQLQPKMLRALETGEVERVGGRGPERARARVIAATNRDLASEVREGRFRQDLYYRLLVVPIRVPPLRDRVEDVSLLARHYLDLACRENRIRAKHLGQDALSVLAGHTWPGNVRELKNAMGRVAILVGEDTVRAEHLDFLRGTGAGSPSAPRAPGGPGDLAGELARHERTLILAALERTRWKMSKAAEELGLERSHLYKKLRLLGIERPPED